MKKILFLLTIVSAISFGKEVVPAPSKAAEVSTNVQKLTKAESFSLAFSMDTKRVTALQFVSTTGGSLTTTPGSTSISTASGERGSRMGVNPNFVPYNYNTGNNPNFTPYNYNSR